MEYRTIKHEDKSYTFYYGIGFLGALVDKLGINVTGIEEAFKANPFKVVPVMLAESLRFAEEMESGKATTTYKEVYELIDSSGGIDGPLVIEFLEGFTKSRTAYVKPGKTPAQAKQTRPKAKAQK